MDRAIIVFLMTFQFLMCSTPHWIKQIPTGENLHYYYFSGLGESNQSLADAKEQAVSNAIQQIMMQGEIAISLTSQSKETSSETMGKNARLSSQYELTKEILISGATEKISGLSIEDEYFIVKPSGSLTTYQYWVLIKKLKPGKAQWEVSQSYGMQGLWRSTIIPGWGQFYKGEPKKGWLFLAGEASLISTAIISRQLSINYADKASRENNLENRKFYNRMSTRTYNIALFAGIAGASLYGYNIFDAISAPGAKIYAGLNLADPLASAHIVFEYTFNQKTLWSIK
jgi:hypothetical protein